jgi:2-polyprenyl-3-methyl-5-hydroxy-6-metoxy-1,4-benzoquinol methylase
MTNTTTAPAPVDLAAVKSRQQATWGSGNYAVIGIKLQLTGELLCEAVDVSAGDRVLDVAAGNGNVSLAAARRGCDVVAPTTCLPCSRTQQSEQQPNT